MRALPHLLLAGLLATAPPAGALTEADCARQREEFRAALESNRVRTVRWVDAALRDARHDEERRALEQEREAAWEHEERMLPVGDQLFRDCTAHVRARAAAAPAR